MSLTSYRTAPPRDIRGQMSEDRDRMWCWRVGFALSLPGLALGLVKRVPRPMGLTLSSVFCLLSSALPRPGGDLLSHALRRSTIGAEGFHGRVRDGIGCGPLAMTTRSREDRVQSSEDRDQRDRGGRGQRGCLF